ncbi:Hypothetical protein, putative [Bodo saltans]|uniref:Uncharacterized protein n=1 Tax=Bodo saltans TaxID=75058 RepID=A0A0S4IZ91_BODSA|nr:Hypothetical protein, putative [Bodo saltans]|eukprot:CUG63746.1 Hypothetical protein, putative [Bodo saltans]
MVVASECANAIGGDAGEQVGELLAFTAAITQAVLAVVEVIVTRLFLGAAALHAASPFRYLESVVQSGAAKIANSLPSSAIKNMLKRPTNTIMPTRHVSIFDEPQLSHQARRSSQPHPRAFVNLTQMKELKNLLQMIAHQRTNNRER